MALTNKIKDKTKRLTEQLGPSAARPASGGPSGPGSPIAYAPGAAPAQQTLSQKIKSGLQSHVPAAAMQGIKQKSLNNSLDGMNLAGIWNSETKTLSPADTSLYSSSSSSSSSSSRKNDRKYDAFSPSDVTSDYLDRLRDIEDEEPGSFTYDPFKTSAKTNEYFDLMKKTEGDKPDAFQSRYEGAVQSILDGILNKKSYNLADDRNYNLLYNQARESYMNAGQKAMRDAMGAAQAQTGGYGSTAAQIAGSQAYDSYLQGLNDQNAALASLAYQMWQDENADRYNQLNAVTGLDNTDYQRWANDYRNWQDDRNYFASQYQNMYGNDWNEYQYGTNMDYNIWQDDYNHWLQNRDYLANQYQQNYDNDMGLYQYDTNLAYQLDRDDIEDAYRDSQFAYQKERDALSDYDDAFKQALTLAQNGIAIPAKYANRLEPETLLALQGIAGQALADGGSGGSGGSGGRRGGGGRKGRGSSSSKGKTAKAYEGIQREHILDEMEKQAAIGGTASAYALGESMLANELQAEGLPYRKDTATFLSEAMDSLSDDTPIRKRKYVNAVRNVGKNLKK